MSKPPPSFNARRPRPRVMRFARAMEAVLRKHDNREGWWQAPYTWWRWFRGLSEERDELMCALRKLARTGYVTRARRAATLAAMTECCDVANFAMMYFDKLAQHFYPDERNGPISPLDFATGRPEDTKD